MNECVGPPGLERIGIASPVPHGTGRGCVEPSALNTKLQHQKSLAAGLEVVVNYAKQSF